MNPVFFYDGSCSFCTNLRSFLEKRLVDKTISFQSYLNFSESELKKIHPDLQHAICAGEVQYIRNGKRYPGFFAVRALSHSLAIYRWLSFLLYLPLVPFIGMAVMYFLKRIRK
ncbi:DCC1-like thiol-disulfide oxidoreductase family protein [Leptospira ryugenii]|uniref:DCC1-like thiol-disulfide oxidoreductase family protein n=1 Tax=Leptospira ryugenii TaxID=1917863 RepID=UPI000D59493E|nr:DCC1-like thiol-disulfide oxidoreductase family protein [Leptospira ryugenii]